MHSRITKLIQLLMPSSFYFCELTAVHTVLIQHLEAVEPAMVHWPMLRYHLEQNRSHSKPSYRASTRRLYLMTISESTPQLRPHICNA